MRQRVYLSLGSNVGDRAANLNSAIEQLRKLGTVVAVSSFFETEPVDFKEQPWFLNCVIALDTTETPNQLLHEILEIERSMGRQRRQKKGPRNIDLDILLFGDSVVDSAELTIPHPALHERRFVLEPLAEIAPDVKHPQLGQTARQLRDALGNDQQIKKFVPSASPGR